MQFKLKNFSSEILSASVALMRVFPKAIVPTTKSHFDVKKTYVSIRGLVVRIIALGKNRISAIEVFSFLSEVWRLMDT